MCLHEKKKTRVNDLVNVSTNEKKIGTLRLACYDIIELNGREFRPENYQETAELLNTIFKGGILIHSVDRTIAKSNSEVKKMFSQWVEIEGWEGLVVRSDMPFIWEIKPRHNIDTVVIGFTEWTGGAKGQVRIMWLALMP